MPAERIGSVGTVPTEVSTGRNANSMSEMLEHYLSCQRLERGQVILGSIVRIASNEIVVDVGAKCEGIVPEHDLDRLSPLDREAIQVGDEVLVYVVNAEDANGNIILSLSRARIASNWHKAQRLLESQEIIESQVVDCNRGGVIVRIGELRGFVPGSQLNLSRVANGPSADLEGENRWAPLVGETLQLKVIEVDQKRNRLILSERVALRDWRRSQSTKLLKELTEGDTRQGRVTSLADFGAFVDLGGIDGLVHLSELSWKRVLHPREVLGVGQEVEVYILRVDRERQRVALSLKRLQPDPWVYVEERYEEGSLVEGMITRLTKWGAFASIIGDEAIEGLIHISELTDDPIVHPHEAVQPGQALTLRVISVDGARRRLGLSLKQASEEEYMGKDWKAVLVDEQPESESSLSVALSEAMGSAEEVREGGPIAKRG
jgi:small subunit ribosomal protein S1